MTFSLTALHFQKLFLNFFISNLLRVNYYFLKKNKEQEKKLGHFVRIETSLKFKCAIVAMRM
jgi:hypothetical protein